MLTLYSGPFLCFSSGFSLFLYVASGFLITDEVELNTFFHNISNFDPKENIVRNPLTFPPQPPCLFFFVYNPCLFLLTAPFMGPPFPIERLNYSGIFFFVPPHQE